MQILYLLSKFILVFKNWFAAMDVKQMPQAMDQQLVTFGYIQQNIHKEKDIEKLFEALPYSSFYKNINKKNNIMQIISQLQNFDIKYVKNHQKIYQQPLIFTVINKSSDLKLLLVRVKYKFFIFDNITIMISNELSPLHKISDKCNGCHGSIYKIKIKTERVAVKCLRIINEDRLYEYFMDALKEFIILKLAYTLKAGPCVENYLGFDIIIYDSCIQFSMQLGDDVQQYSQQLQQNLQYNLAILHFFNVIHCDIKPENICYSPKLKRYVFIDFGLADITQCNIGEKKLTFFIGSLQYCCPEMRKCFFEGQMPIDFYENDIFSLQESIKQIVSWKRLSNCRDQIEYFNCYPNFIMIRIKYWLLINLKRIRNLQFSPEKIKKEIIQLKNQQYSQIMQVANKLPYSIHFKFLLISIETSFREIEFNGYNQDTNYFYKQFKIMNNMPEKQLELSEENPKYFQLMFLQPKRALFFELQLLMNCKSVMVLDDQSYFTMISPYLMIDTLNCKYRAKLRICKIFCVRYQITEGNNDFHRTLSFLFQYCLKSELNLALKNLIGKLIVTFIAQEVMTQQQLIMLFDKILAINISKNQSECEKPLLLKYLTAVEWIRYKAVTNFHFQEIEYIIYKKLKVFMESMSQKDREYFNQFQSILFYKLKFHQIDGQTIQKLKQNGQFQCHDNFPYFQNSNSHYLQIKCFVLYLQILRKRINLFNKNEHFLITELYSSLASQIPTFKYFYFQLFNLKDKDILLVQDVPSLLNLYIKMFHSCSFYQSSEFYFYAAIKQLDDRFAPEEHYQDYLVKLPIKTIVREKTIEIHNQALSLILDKNLREEKLNYYFNLIGQVDYFGAILLGKISKAHNPQLYTPRNDLTTFIELLSKIKMLNLRRHQHQLLISKRKGYIDSLSTIDLPVQINEKFKILFHYSLIKFIEAIQLKTITQHIFYQFVGLLTFCIKEQTLTYLVVPVIVIINQLTQVGQTRSDLITCIGLMSPCYNNSLLIYDLLKNLKLLNRILVELTTRNFQDEVVILIAQILSFSLKMKSYSTDFNILKILCIYFISIQINLSVIMQKVYPNYFITAVYFDQKFSTSVHLHQISKNLITYQNNVFMQQQALQMNKFNNINCIIIYGNGLYHPQDVKNILIIIFSSVKYFPSLTKRLMISLCYFINQIKDSNQISSNPRLLRKNIKRKHKHLQVVTFIYALQNIDTKLVIQRIIKKYISLQERRRLIKYSAEHNYFGLILRSKMDKFYSINELKLHLCKK